MRGQGSSCEYACGEYFISCENGCMDIPPCFHSSEKATAEEWNRSTLADHLITNGVRLETKQATETSDEKTSEWIPVSERLPEIRKKVLILHKFGPTIGEYRGYDICPGKKQFYWCGTKGSKDTLKTVTHWMPLPEPPKGE